MSKFDIFTPKGTQKNHDRGLKSEIYKLGSDNSTWTQIEPLAAQKTPKFYDFNQYFGQ